MADSNDLTSNIAGVAAGMKRASGDSGSAEAQPVGDIIKADQYLKANQALARTPLGIRMVKLRPGGNADLPHRDFI